MRNALVAAARRGVEVSVIVPLHNNRRVLRPSGRMLRELTRHGVRVCQYASRGGMTHTKALVVDERAMFGSSNFNEALAGVLDEVTIVTHNRDLVGGLTARLASDMDQSRRLR